MTRDSSPGRDARVARGSRPIRKVDPAEYARAVALALAAPEVREDRIADLASRIRDAAWAERALARELPDSLLDALLGNAGSAGRAGSEP